MDDRTQEQITRLEATIAQQEQEVFKLETDIAELRRELDPFADEYKSVVKSVSDRVDAMRDAIRDFEIIQRKTMIYDDGSEEKLWEAVTQASAPPRKFESKREEIPPEPLKPFKKPKADESLKQLYRRLARLFHPDLAEDEADREHRNYLMTLINEAYANRDREALLALDNESHDDPLSDKSRHEVPLSMLKLRKLQQKSVDLANRVQDLRIEHQDLFYSDLMELKIQYKLAKAGGRDLLKEIADELEQEYWELMKRFDNLRNQST